MSNWTPLRTCAVCRKKLPKSELIRIVKFADGTIKADETGKAQGRGCYVCKNDSCIEKFIKKKGANRSFKTNVKEDVYEQIKRLQDR
ncbi:MAG: YlxR family protein [Clostridia bacterium]|nr:YlxR family protein [Clostridia bacterium]